MSDNLLSDLLRQLHELEQQRASLPELWKRRQRRHVFETFGDNPKVSQAISMLESVALREPYTDQERQEAQLLETQIARVQRLIEEERGRRPGVRPQAPPSVDLEARAKWLKDELRRRKWTEGELSDKSGVDRKTIKKIIRAERVGDAPLDKLQSILPELK
jgi:hypothetical protein